MININKIPQKPGCYIFKDKKNKIIYIGKAKNLYKRVKFYFGKIIDKHEGFYWYKTIKMVKEINDIDFIITKNEVSALVLESELVRKHKPVYNLDLKENTPYSYIMITNEEYPRLEISRKIVNQKNYYYGPFTNTYVRNASIKIIRDFFKLRTCKRLPKIPCLNFYIKKCNAPCIQNVSVKEYQENVKLTKLFLEGKNKEIKEVLTNKMNLYAKNKEYETAKEIRDQILTLTRIKEHKNNLIKQKDNEDYINYIINEEKIVIQVFKVKKGVVSAKKEYVLKNQELIISEFITRFYSNHFIPTKIYLPTVIEDKELLEQFLSLKKGRKVKIIIPKKGDKIKTLNLVKDNILYSPNFENKGLVRLKEVLNLINLPQRIECFDISTLGGENTTASMVSFKFGVPDKTNYRKFKIKTVVNKTDDYKSMKEVVFRRYRDLILNKKEFPDLIVIDGGKGQLSVAFSVLQDLGLNIPIIGLAKKFEEIYIISSQKPIKLKSTDQGLKLLQRIRDEAHRFAVKYHKVLRKKAFEKI